MYNPWPEAIVKKNFWNKKCTGVFKTLEIIRAPIIADFIVF